VDPEALVASSGALDEEVSGEEMKVSDKDPQATAAAIGRLECIYFKLWAALRWAVRVAFLTHEDVLDAGGEVQVSAKHALHPLRHMLLGIIARGDDWGNRGKGFLHGRRLQLSASRGLRAAAGAYGLHECPWTDRED
jgi:hypothetical protein